MKYLYLILAFSTVLFILGACKGTKKSAVISSKAPSIVLKKGKCFGRCKAYSFSIFEDYSAAFNGIKNVDFIGDYQAHVSASVYNELVRKLADASFDGMQNEYLSKAKDLPEIELTFNGKSIRFHNQKAPEELRQLGIMIEKVAFAQAWEQSK